MAKVLVVDDEANIRKTLKDVLEDENHDVILADNGEKGLELYKEEQPDVVLMDIQMPKKDGLTLLGEVKALNNKAEIIMISGHGTIDIAVQALKAGAYHFLEKPLSLIQVTQSVMHAAKAKSQRDELDAFKDNEDARYNIISKSSGMEQIKKEIAKVAPTNGRVLIKGESGTGKELVAYAIHKNSPRLDGPFIKINCAAIPENLIESELFGHEKGAFTGALAQKKGKFELANGGTLLMDEIGDMDMNTQTKVLRAIQEGEIERVGGTRTMKVDVRLLAATHRDLDQMIAEGTFREDLYYRLNVVPLTLPPLRERAEDIPVLAEYILKQYLQENGSAEKKFSASAISMLCQQKFPGNIRELKNIVERAAIMSEGNEITDSFLKSFLEGGSLNQSQLFTKPRSLTEAKEDLERLYVQTQLELSNWDIPKTAEILDMQRTNLHRKIKQLGIEKN